MGHVKELRSPRRFQDFWLEPAGGKEAAAAWAWEGSRSSRWAGESEGHVRLSREDVGGDTLVQPKRENPCWRPTLGVLLHTYVYTFVDRVCILRSETQRRGINVAHGLQNNDLGCLGKEVD